MHLCNQVLRGRAAIAQVLCRLGCCAKTTGSTTLGDGRIHTSQGHWLLELEYKSGSAFSTAATMYVCYLVDSSATIVVLTSSSVDICARSIISSTNFIAQVAILFGGNDHMFELNEIRNVATIGYDTGAIYGGRDLSSRVRVSYQCLHVAGADRY